MSKRNIKITNIGSNIYLNTDNKNYLLSNSTYSNLSTEDNNSEYNNVFSRFKLATVRKLKIDDINKYKNLLDNYGTSFALANKPTFPTLPYNTSSNILYGIFVDEDLYPDKPPIYVFQSPIATMRPKVFITANGMEEDDWSVHIVHLSCKVEDEYNIPLYFYRIVTIDNLASGLTDSNIKPFTTYILDTAYDICNVTITSLNSINGVVKNIGFCRAYHINNFTYGGGGLFSAFALDMVGEGVPSYTRKTYIGETSDLYYDFGNPNRNLEIYRNISVSYHFSWLRGNLVFSTPSTKEYNVNTTVEDVVRTDFQSKFEFTYTIKPSFKNIKPIQHSEKSECSYSLIRNKNIRIDSIRTNFDYGTFIKLGVIEKYNQFSSCVRPKFDESLNPSSKYVVNDMYFPYVIADQSCNTLIWFRAEGNGSINHTFEISETIGERGITYSWDHPNWYTLGKIISVVREPYTPLFDRPYNPIYYPQSHFPANYTYSNNVLTTLWTVPADPPVRKIPLDVVGRTIKFRITYQKPPFFRHHGVYYYEVNPPIIARYFDRLSYFEANRSETIITPYDFGTIASLGYGVSSGSNPGGDAFSQRESYKKIYNEFRRRTRGREEEIPYFKDQEIPGERIPRNPGFEI